MLTPEVKKIKPKSLKMDKISMKPSNLVLFFIHNVSGRPKHYTTIGLEHGTVIK